MAGKFFTKFFLISPVVCFLGSAAPAFQTAYAESWEKSANDRPPPA